MLLICLGLGACRQQRESSAPAEIFRAGALAPKFSLPALDGSTVTNTALHGKTVLLNFWATWCAPCVAEMPALQRIHSRLQDQGFTVIAVNVDPPEQRARVAEFVRQHGLTFPVLLDPQLQCAGRYGTSGFPETFFISRSGRLLPFADPVSGRSAVRVLSDRSWDDPQFVAAITSLLQQP